jgi:protein-S-isoprenylcysteine O-methyltransferase Ste14
VLINTSPEPFSNWVASVGEDIAVIGGVWACINHPLLFLAVLVLFVLLMIWLLPRIWAGVKKVFRFIINLFRRDERPLNAESQE